VPFYCCVGCSELNANTLTNPCLLIIIYIYSVLFHLLLAYHFLSCIYEVIVVCQIGCCIWANDTKDLQFLLYWKLQLHMLLRKCHSSIDQTFDILNERSNKHLQYNKDLQFLVSLSLTQQN